MEFNPDVTIETSRLRLRFMKKEDTHDIFLNINNSRDVLLFFLDKYCEKEEEMTLDKTIEFCLGNKRYLFAIELKETGETIGMILQCSSPDRYFHTSEVGYALGKKHWGKGYAAEALQAMIDFLFSLGVHKVTASHILANVSSKKVMEKCGMIYEGRRKDEIYYREQYFDVDFYYILNPNQQ